MKRIGNNDFLSLTEIANSLGTQEDSVRLLLEENAIPYVMIEDEGYVLEDEFLKMFKRNNYENKMLKEKRVYPITEKEILAETIEILKIKRKISITELREYLKQTMQLSEEDLSINMNRNDTKFDQKVRNLVSHRNSNGLFQYCKYENGFLYLKED